MWSLGAGWCCTRERRGGRAGARERTSERTREGEGEREGERRERRRDRKTDRQTDRQTDWAPVARATPRFQASRHPVAAPWTPAPTRPARRYAHTVIHTSIGGIRSITRSRVCQHPGLLSHTCRLTCAHVHAHTWLRLHAHVVSDWSIHQCIRLAIRTIITWGSDGGA